MKLISILLLIIFTISVTAKSLNDGKKLILKITDRPVNIDGKIDPAWSLADSTTKFMQHSPMHNQDPSRRTVAKILTDENSFYCLIICYDDKKNIEAHTGTLDDFSGDVVSLMLDTFNDRRTAYKFAVSASGVRMDSRMLDDARNRDYSWDGIWFADSRIYDWGFVVEIEIPYKSIQYDSELTDWGLDFDRWIPHLKEDIYWCAYDENEGQRISKFGKVIFNDFKPEVKGLNLEIYPVGISKITELSNGNYKVDPDAGLDIFYNPSPKLSFQFTANPDFAQIEADPFDFNISRYESYFSERRPFFTEGQEVFQASGKQRNTGFYSPLELFYSRRIGKKLPDGTEVPLIFGTKAFGRLGEWEYGGFAALTGERTYMDGNEKKVEKRAYFGSARVKKQIFENSSIGFLFVGKHDEDGSSGVLDIDGALRDSDWQLAYQFARSFRNSKGDYALSAGFTQFKQNWMTLARARYIGENFDIDQVGYVPWKGDVNIVALTGPRFYYETGELRAILLYFGGYTGWQKEDEFWDYGGLIGYNMNFRSDWGFEINIDGGKSKDLDVNYSSFSTNISSWFNPTPTLHGNLWGGYQRTYNFSREYLAFYSWMGASLSYKVLDYLDIGTDYNMYIEGNPDGEVEDITYNARPFFSLTPVNDLNIKMYIDNVYVKSTDRMEQIIAGFFFAYNFSPKSWIYFAFNEVQDRSSRYDDFGNLLPNRMHTINRAAVLKLKYLYYL
ncbi:MAG: carbohydrate binding family 9 domain-containing protein [Melioribacteraceae bacterium]|nr:carbohydrate binding family 9 domain-containing protein [Melioribacteraceae bacterium]